MAAKDLEISKLQTTEDAEACAKMMSGSEPWITLGRDYGSSLKTITDPLKEVYLVKSRGKVAGFIVLIMKGALVGYVQSICIAPAMRGRGIGSKLLRLAEKRIFYESPNVFLMVSSFNDGAQRLYKKLGYETVGELKDYIVPGHSEILMRKTVGSMSDFKKA